MSKHSIINCLTCNNGFKAYQCEIRNGRRFCSKICASEYKKKQNKLKVKPIITEKFCRFCKKINPINKYRIRIKRGYSYRQGKCMNCELKEEKIRRDGLISYLKENPELYAQHKKIKANKSKEYYHKNNSEIKAKLKEIRKIPDNSIIKLQRDYAKKNKEKIKQQHKKRLKKYQENLTDLYVKEKISFVTGISVKRLSEITKTDKSLIEAKRLQIQLIRKIKQTKNGK